MNVVLVMFLGDGQRRSFSLARDMTVIGRREDCDLRIPVGDVSRKHCRFIREAGTLRIEDLGSSNGTFVNGDRVQESEILPGDNVKVGPVQFVVQIDGHPADDELADPTAIVEVGATGEYPALDELPSEEAELEPEVTELTELPADAALDLDPPPLPEFAPGATEVAEPLELDTEVPAEPGELPTIDEDPASAPEPFLAFGEEDEAELNPLLTPVGETPEPPPPPLPALHETQALPADEIPSPGVVETVPELTADADDGEWNFVLEEAEAEPADEVDLGSEAPREGQPRGHK